MTEAEIREVLEDMVKERERQDNNLKGIFMTLFQEKTIQSKWEDAIGRVMNGPYHLQIQEYSKLLMVYAKILEDFTYKKAREVGVPEDTVRQKIAKLIEVDDININQLKAAGEDNGQYSST